MRKEIMIVILMISRLFLQIRPVRDSMTEALQLWKKLAGNTDGAAESQNESQGVVIRLPFLLPSGRWRITFFVRAI